MQHTIDFCDLMKHGMVSSKGQFARVPLHMLFKRLIGVIQMLMDVFQMLVLQLLIARLVMINSHP
jgi:hypothetical protein